MNARLIEKYRSRLFGDRVARIAFGFKIEQVRGLGRKLVMGTSECAFSA
jgi:hypothetical protein